MSQVREDALAADAAYAQSNGKLALPPARALAVLTRVGARIDPGEASSLSRSGPSGSTLAQGNGASIWEDHNGPRSGVRLRVGADAEPAQRCGREAAFVDGWASELDGHAFLRTLEMVALVIPLERG